MSKLTHKALQALTAANEGQLVRDEGNLFGRVRMRANTGLVVNFYYRYRQGARLRDISCGTWPLDSLGEIRARRDNAREDVTNGLDPSIQRKVRKIEVREVLESKIAKAKQERTESLTVRDLFETWLADGVRRLDDNANLKRSFAADVLPKIGHIPVKSLTDADIRAVLRAMVARGVNRSAVALRNDLKQMLNWAQKRQPWRKLMVEGNPIELVEIERIVDRDYDMRGVRERVLADDEIAELDTKLRRMREDYLNALNRREAQQPLEVTTECAIWIMLSTMCRVGELTMGRWEHVNWQRREWFIPKENVKDRLSSITISLSDFALVKFRRLQESTGHTGWLFPNSASTKHISTHTIAKQIGDRQLIFKHGRDGGPRKQMTHRHQDNSLVLGQGKRGEWTPHDLRRTGATIMQSLGIALDVIDRCQNHVLAGSKVRRHYLHYDYAKEKQEAWACLGSHLTEVICSNLD